MKCPICERQIRNRELNKNNYHERCFDKLSYEYFLLKNEFDEKRAEDIYSLIKFFPKRFRYIAFKMSKSY